MKYNLKDYKKLKLVEKTQVTSVSITDEQRKFLESRNINVSKIFRAFLDDLIKQNKGGE